MCLCLHSYLLYVLLILNLNRHKLKEALIIKHRRCKKLYFSLTDNFKDKILWKFYFAQYLLKRLHLSLILICINNSNAQIFIFIILNSLSWIYWIGLRPYKKIFYNIVLWINEITLLWTGFLMIAFLDSQTTYTLLGTILIVVFSANLILLFACSWIYEFINLFKHWKDKRKQTRTEMKYVTPKITQRVELKRRKLSDAWPKQEGTTLIQLYYYIFLLILSFRKIWKTRKIGK